VYRIPFDYDRLCLKPDRFGAELEFRVNTTTEKVQIIVVKNDGNWWVGDQILDNCSVVDDSNWTCSETTGTPGGPIHVVEAYGMSRGRYYRSLPGGGPPNYYTSSISGETFWALNDGSISVLTAMESTGYSRTSLASFQDPGLQAEIQGKNSREGKAHAAFERERKNYCDDERKRWALVSVSEIDVLSASLKSVNQDYYLATLVKNKSQSKVTALRLIVTALDCPTVGLRATNCKIVGRGERTFETDIPAVKEGQIEGAIALHDVAEPRGVLTANVTVEGVRAPLDETDNLAVGAYNCRKLESSAQ
jgi:hypothetical protein